MTVSMRFSLSERPFSPYLGYQLMIVAKGCLTLPVSNKLTQPADHLKQLQES
ncbi:hypothetical protein HMPREF1557_00575 [Streptococcus sobrinus W1703]|uniref:Uncharacterized protein n=1 Tax=Streptococcus sobrinus W1703 TaxID=1227275 RepID=U2KSD6_9STRE|nr:hypothetical protein HMPREF1557_00575 [Streptococcus sobrinus W1703]